MNWEEIMEVAPHLNEIKTQLLLNIRKAVYKLVELKSDGKENCVVKKSEFLKSIGVECPHDEGNGLFTMKARKTGMKI